MPGAAPARARADPRRAAQGGAAADTARRARRGDAAAAARGDDARAAAARARLRRSAPTAAPRSRRRRSPRRRARPSAASGRPREEELFGPAETLHVDVPAAARRAARRRRRRSAARLGELRFDTDLDVAHAVVRYLELVKLAALLERTRAGEPVGRRRAARDQRRGCCRRRPPSSARSSRRARSTSSCSTPSATSGCARGAVAARDGAVARAVPAHAAATGSLLSASDIETYRTCPLKYKFARVFRIPSEPTINQRFGILVHQVLERYHGRRAPSRALPSCSGCSRPAGGAAASATPRRSASCAAKATQRAASATTTASPTRTASRCGSSGRSSSAGRRTCCAAASTASTGCPTAATS